MALGVGPTYRPRPPFAVAASQPLPPGVAGGAGAGGELYKTVGQSRFLDHALTYIYNLR